MSTDARFKPTCLPVGRTGVALAALAFAAVLSGCGGVRGGRMIQLAPEASYDHYFFVGIPDPEVMSESERRKRIEDEIERLATPAWDVARQNLFRLGRPAVELLIANLDRTEQSSASVRPVPGPTVPTKQETWSLGYVVYTVLLDLVGHYSNYEGTDLPAFDVRAWNSWWTANSKGIRVYSAESTAPPYVRVQIAQARAALTSRYSPLARVKAAEAEKKAKAERKRKKKVREKRDRREREKKVASKADRRARRKPVAKEARSEVAAKPRHRPEPEPEVELELEREPAKREPAAEAPRGRRRRRGRGRERPAPEAPAEGVQPAAEPVEEPAEAEKPEEAVEDEPEREESEKIEPEPEKEEPDKEEEKPSRSRRRRRRRR